MGEVRVPVDAYWGASTQRAVENFPVSGLRFPRRFIEALGTIKWAAAKANEELGVLTEAWGPIARGGELLRDDVIARLADKHARTPAQIVLRWHIELGHVAIPKSVTPSRIRENLDIGRPDMVQLIFNRRVTKRTPGRFRTRVLTDGVIPSLHVD